MTAEAPRITVSRNPMGYFCAPNAADCHYAPAHDMKDFIAYGLLASYLDPDEISPGYEITDQVIRDLREGFLRCVEITASMLPHVRRGELADFGSHGTGCSLYRPGMDGPGSPEKYLDLEWVFDMRDRDGAVCLALRCLTEDGQAGDDFAIWVDSRCFNNRRRLTALIREARSANTSRR